MVVVRIWRNYSFVLIGVLVGTAIVIVLLSFILPSWRSLDTFGNPSGIILGALYSGTMLAQPRMGKREFVKRYRNLPRFMLAYYRDVPRSVLVLHSVLLALGLALSAWAIVVAPGRPGFLELNGAYSVIHDTERSAVGLDEFTQLIVARNIWSPMGAIVALGALLFAFASADRYLGSRPQIWPESRPALFGRR